jgi:hypothetical protein
MTPQKVCTYSGQMQLSFHIFDLWLVKSVDVEPLDLEVSLALLAMAYPPGAAFPRKQKSFNNDIK